MDLITGIFKEKLMPMFTDVDSLVYEINMG